MSHETLARYYGANETKVEVNVFTGSTTMDTENISMSEHRRILIAGPLANRLAAAGANQAMIYLPIHGYFEQWGATFYFVNRLIPIINWLGGFVRKTDTSRFAETLSGKKNDQNLVMASIGLLLTIDYYWTLEDLRVNWRRARGDFVDGAIHKNHSLSLQESSGTVAVNYRYNF